jgi:hypothetical protein
MNMAFTYKGNNMASEYYVPEWSLRYDFIASAQMR